jgi:hypothetical protein
MPSDRKWRVHSNNSLYPRNKPFWGAQLLKRFPAFYAHRSTSLARCSSCPIVVRHKYGDDSDGSGIRNGYADEHQQQFTQNRKSTSSRQTKNKKQTPWSESASELYRPSDRRLSAKWLPTFADKGCHVLGVTDPYGRILGFLDRSRYFSIK